MALQVRGSRFDAAAESVISCANLGYATSRFARSTYKAFTGYCASWFKEYSVAQGQSTQLPPMSRELPQFKFSQRLIKTYCGVRIDTRSSGTIQSEGGKLYFIERSIHCVKQHIFKNEQELILNLAEQHPEVDTWEIDDLRFDCTVFWHFDPLDAKLDKCGSEEALNRILSKQVANGCWQVKRLDVSADQNPISYVVDRSGWFSTQFETFASEADFLASYVKIRGERSSRGRTSTLLLGAATFSSLFLVSSAYNVYTYKDNICHFSNTSYPTASTCINLANCPPGSPFSIYMEIPYFYLVKGYFCVKSQIIAQVAMGQCMTTPCIDYTGVIVCQPGITPCPK